MFALFFSLYISMFTGTWTQYNDSGIGASLKPALNKIGLLITSIFGDFQVTDFGEQIYVSDWFALVSFILSLITCIGIVVLAVKGIKRIFAVFFTFGR